MSEKESHVKGECDRKQQKQKIENRKKKEQQVTHLK